MKMEEGSSSSEAAHMLNINYQNTFRMETVEANNDLHYDKRKKHWWRKRLDHEKCSIRAFLNQISVEPVMFLYMFAFSMTQVVEQAFFLEKACSIDLKIDPNICSHLEKEQYENQKVAVHSRVSEFLQYNNIAAHGATVLLALVLGSWSDAVGRKAPLLLGLAGKFFYSAMIVVNAVEWTGGNHWPLYTILYSATLPSAITGADVAIFLGCFSYLSDITSPKDRTWRVAILDAVYLLTMPTGVALGAYLFSIWNRSFAALFALNAGMLLAAFFYTVIRLEWKTARIGPRSEATAVEHGEEEPKGSSRLIHERGDDPVASKIEKKSNDASDLATKSKPNKGCFWKLFDWHHVLELWKTVMRYRKGKKRAALLTIFLAMALYTFQRDERTMSYLYTQKVFNWDLKTYSDFRTVQSALYVAATLFGLPLLSRTFGLHDTIIAALGAISSSCARLTFGLAGVPNLFYLGAAFAAFGPLIPPVLRSMTSKLVPPSERGKVFAVLSSADNAVPLFSGAMYSQLYNATLKTFPASIFFLTLGSQISVLFLVLGVHYCLGGGHIEQAQETDIEENEPVKEIQE